jgi:hypothetical protein
MKIKSNSGARRGTRIAPLAPIVEKPVINEVEGIEEVIEDDDDEEDISVDGGVG